MVNWQVTRLSEPPAVAALTVADLVCLGVERHEPRPDVRDEAQALALLLQAERVLETRFGVVARPAEFRMAGDLDVEAATNRVDLPLAPVAALTSASADGRDLPLRLVPGGMLASKGRLAVELLAGWPAGRMPHLVQAAMCRMAAHWLRTPADIQAGGFEPTRGTVEQYLALFGPRCLASEEVG